MNLHTRKILVELDALFDTVLGTLGAMSPQNAVDVLLSPSYACRYIDEFEGFDTEEFKKRYAIRDRITLKNSTVTRALFYVHEFTQSVAANTMDTPIIQDSSVVINTYPYLLEDSELEMIRSILRTRLPLRPEIEFVHLSMDKLNPLYISKNYSAVLLYNFNLWLEHFVSCEDFVKYPCFRVRFIAPTLLRTKEGLEPGINLVDKFVEVMEYLNPMIDLLYIPTENFCSVLANQRSVPSAPKDTEQDSEKEKIKPESGSPRPSPDI